LEYVESFIRNFLSSGIFFLFSFLLIIPALTLHEWSHAWMANRLGDPTPRMMGRLSINPLRHIDPIGTVLLPIGLLIFSGGAFTFGYAKPVPFNPRYLKDQRKGTALIGIAGPAMNVILALGTTFLLLLAVWLLPAITVLQRADSGMIVQLAPLGILLARFAYINLVLCFFNLLPIPPFDGSRVVQKFLKGNARHYYAQLEQYGMWIVLGIIAIPPMLFGFSLIGIYFRFTAQLVFTLLTGIPLSAAF